jgi:hypothetical protein
MPAVLAGIILYAFIRARRERLGQIPAPTDPATAVIPPVISPAISPVISPEGTS